MFRSIQLFTSIECPYAKARLCQRPYCPYKHSQSTSLPSDSTESPALYSSVLASTAAPAPVHDQEKRAVVAKRSLSDVSSQPERSDHGSTGDADKSQDEAKVSKLTGIAERDRRRTSVGETTDHEHNAVKQHTTSKEHPELLGKHGKGEKIELLASIKEEIADVSKKEDDVISISSSCSSAAARDASISRHDEEVQLDSDEMEYLCNESFEDEPFVASGFKSTETETATTKYLPTLLPIKAEVVVKTEGVKQKTSSIVLLDDSQSKMEASKSTVEKAKKQQKFGENFEWFSKPGTNKPTNHASAVARTASTSRPADSDEAVAAASSVTKEDSKKKTNSDAYSGKCTVPLKRPITESSKCLVAEPPAKRFHDSTATQDSSQRAEQQGKVRNEPRVSHVSSTIASASKPQANGAKAAASARKSNWQPPKLNLIVPKSYNGLPVFVRQAKLQCIFKQLCDANDMQTVSENEALLSRLQKLAFEIEAECVAKCVTKVAYEARVVRELMLIRRREREAQASLASDEQEAGASGSLSHADMLNGPKAQQCSFTYTRTEGAQRAAHRAASERDISERELSERLRRFMATETQLEANGFPRKDPEERPQTAWLPVSERDAAKTSKARLSEAELTRGLRVCTRCGERFSVHVEHNLYQTPTRPDACRYHPNKAYKRSRVAGNWEFLFECCDAPKGSPGCKTHTHHVHDASRMDPTGYVTTTAHDLPTRCSVLALDCEMVYTIGGYELARVSAVNARLQVVADWFVRPTSTVLDYNERFSGMRASFFDAGSEEYKGDRIKTYAETQQELLKLISADTLLVGHSLENDMLVLRIVHSSVIDTSLLYPHKSGPPSKRALRTLAFEELREIVQDGVDGHDSVQDARTCMKIVIKKLCDEDGVTFSFADIDTH